MPNLKIFHVQPIYTLFPPIKYLHVLLNHPIECGQLQSVRFEQSTLLTVIKYRRKAGLLNSRMEFISEFYISIYF